ncbi:hypothetical protein [Streptomyces sp. NPDC000880]
MVYPYSPLSAVRTGTQRARKVESRAITVHADSPDGPVVASFENVPYTGSTSLSNRVYKTFTTPVTDPGGVHDLYFVGDWPAGTQPELFVRNFTFG